MARRTSLTPQTMTMNNVANCSFAHVICAGKVLRGPRISPVQKDSQSLCSRNGIVHDRVLLGY
jgi:hypothetical protein